MPFIEGTKPLGNNSDGFRYRCDFRRSERLMVVDIDIAASDVFGLNVAANATKPNTWAIRFTS